MKNITIAIDGPSGSGKSTIAKAISKKLNINYLDTGAMYRAITLYCLNNNISVNNLDEIIKALKSIELSFSSSGILLNGQNVEKDIRTNNISKEVSKFASILEIRNFCSKQQKDISKLSSCVMDGRDIGTVIMPNATLKIWLAADIEERAIRRMNELKMLVNKDSIKEMIDSMSKRDFEDENRKNSPLKKTKDYYEINSTRLTIDKIVQLIIERLKEITNV